MRLGISLTSLILEKVIRSFLPTSIGFGIFITPYVSTVYIRVAVYYFITIKSIGQPPLGLLTKAAT